MRRYLSAIIDRSIFVILVILAVLTPLVFTPFTTEFFETPKIITLSSAVLILLILWSFSWVLAGKVIITRTPLDLPLVLLTIIVLISTFLSDSRYVSIFGNFPRIHGSAITWVLYILLYFISVSNIKGILQARIIIFALTAGVFVNSVIVILSYSGIYLPLPFTQNMAFNPAGSPYSGAAVAALLLPIIYIHILRPSKILTMPLSLIGSIIFGITLILIGSLTLQIISLTSMLLLIALSDRKNIKTSLPFLIVPILIPVLILILSYVPLPQKNPLELKRETFTNQFQELQLPLRTSWIVAVSSFRDSPAFGTGPSTFLFNFTRYKPADINLTRLWNFRFDTSFNEFFQVLATLGSLGFLAFIYFIVVLLKLSLKALGRSEGFAVGLSISVLTFITLLTLHVSTPVIMVAGIMIIATLIAFHKSEGKIEEFTLRISTSKIKEAGFNSDSLNSITKGDALPIILFIPVVILTLVGMWHGYRIVSADYFHRLGLNNISQKGLQAYDQLRMAENLNPMIDLYHTDMAQTNFLIANAIATAKAPARSASGTADAGGPARSASGTADAGGPSESSPAGSLTDQDKTNIQQFLSQSINEAKIAVQLSPRSAQNWEIIASIYRQITGVAQNALNFSLDSYGRAIALDPYNPLLRLNVGGLYYSIRNYDMAIRFFDDAVKLKPDYANAYYNLSIALRDKGNLKEAETVATKVVEILQANTQNPDYRIAADYLKDLKARIATGSAQNSEITAPAGAQTGALQNEALPQVPLDQLENEPNVTIPPAVKK